MNVPFAARREPLRPDPHAHWHRDDHTLGGPNVARRRLRPAVPVRAVALARRRDGRALVKVSGRSARGQLDMWEVDAWEVDAIVAELDPLGLVDRDRSHLKPGADL